MPGASDDLAQWLHCPQCGADLTAVDALRLACPRGHSFDVNKRGYVSLVPPGDRMQGDDARMLDARAAFLEPGRFAPIRDALLSALPDTAVRVLDAGCGTGYYLEGALSHLGPAAAALALDLSPEAVRRTVRLTGAAGLVADTWRPLPVRTGVADLVLDVFAPRNLPEFARVLAPGGMLAVVIPAADHLRELREAGRAIDVAAGKLERLRADAQALFSLDAITPVSFRMELDAAAAAALIGMGPSAHHRDTAGEAVD
ncbi:methyltransferase domain-containing protein, partial [Rathayibacter sp. YIM 133350]|uniref:methyltransferase domain-containing protein n=1 Tax=Rathayibacter sp. YIM 133350 TaxID=3131992 RepID=UPI00307F676F